LEHINDRVKRKDEDEADKERRAAEQRTQLKVKGRQVP
jgi:hypothetical protein